jgi:hypothetical protein
MYYLLFLHASWTMVDESLEIEHQSNLGSKYHFQTTKEIENRIDSDCMTQ